MFRKQFEIAAPSDVTTPVVPTVESPKNPATPRGQKKGSWLGCLGGAMGMVMWWKIYIYMYICIYYNIIEFRHCGFKDCVAQCSVILFGYRVCMDKIHRPYHQALLTVLTCSRAFERLRRSLVFDTSRLALQRSLLTMPWVCRMKAQGSAWGK